MRSGRRFGRVLCAVAISVVWPSVSAASEAAAASGEAIAPSEDAAVSPAVEKSRELRALENQVKVQDARVESSASLVIANPELRLSKVSTRYAYDVNHQLAVGLRWKLPRLGELAVQEGKERVRLLEMKTEASKFRLELIAATRGSYARTALLGEYVKVLEHELRLRQEAVTATERLVHLGQRAVLDQIRAGRRLVKAEGDVSEARQRLAEARRQLSVLIGDERAAAAIASLVVTEPRAVTLSGDQVRALAQQKRQEVILSEQRLKYREAQYDSGRRGQIPWLSFVELAYRYESDRRDYAELSVGIDLPWLNGHTGERVATTVASEGNDDDRAGTAESIEREVAEAWEHYQRAMAQWRSLQMQAARFLPGARHVLEEAKRRRTMLADDVVEIELNTLGVEEALLEARLAVTDASAELGRVVGIERWDELASGG